MKTIGHVSTYMAGTCYAYSRIFFNTEEDAKDFILTLKDLLYINGKVSIHDLFQKLKIEVNDEKKKKWGWISFNGAFASKRLISNEYEIILPKPIILPQDPTIDISLLKFMRNN